VTRAQAPHGVGPSTSAGALSAREAIRDDLAFTVDVAGDERSGIVGYKAPATTDLIDVDRIDYYDPRDFWGRSSPIAAGGLADRARPGTASSLGSDVATPDHAAEMLPYRSASASFASISPVFDPASALRDWRAAAVSRSTRTNTCSDRGLADPRPPV
jgi:hypothetical protein